MSMAAGEYVSVSSQADTEKADLARETAELTTQPGLERQELADIYMARGLDPDLALKVADQLMRSEEHTSELQSLMRISYAVFCLKKKKQRQPNTPKDATG